MSIMYIFMFLVDEGTFFAHFSLTRLDWGAAISVEMPVTDDLIEEGPLRGTPQEIFTARFCISSN